MQWFSDIFAILPLVSSATGFTTQAHETTQPQHLIFRKSSRMTKKQFLVIYFLVNLSVLIGEDF